MSAHPKGQNNATRMPWQIRHDAKSAMRMRRRKAGLRHQFQLGDAIDTGDPECQPRVTEIFSCRRAASLTLAPLLIEGTTQAIAWADAHRRHECPSYDLCLDAAARAGTEMRLRGLHTWECCGCPRERS